VRALDAAASRFVVHTFAEGLLARLAHDLELVAEGATGELVDGPEPTVTLRFPIDGLRVVGAVKKGRVEPSVLSEADRFQIEEKLRRELFVGRRSLTARGSLPVGGEARIELDGVRARVAGVPRWVDAELHGRCELSLRAMGLKPVEGPMGAFRLADRVEVEFRARFTP